ncbi:ethanolamine utilization protein EutH [Candidatus Giovannonibacteria bacterium RIFCSPHIGHO2_01_FULL_45_33]|uniref:Ethanolamine utilization protein EutH n=1 Tax=Candidatus Giovannonibacteria bacterium RIFCSPLOWO2_01_FULL_45_34 TaxID=1798351 RepID=A0A1F5WZ99_9BACT|nr:MAG: ethanolamine utilization protein EutH [Candidatus Giovannonibacteria bacterium RIFCSPHIGHO2_01_FULL_45_33]OGF69538.1 MAG: ethanolamine utilization protein EutH [Candidatus Giovannonibacteria bacterium RIFCSPHIGHO2_02_FULL_44_11]OGF80976.1 MAG: ethanolamine utilization protein EutH [Candidatus Giovannonibacteria bacterium RIFCSPLOWO2_01_FULL_45_34]
MDIERFVLYAITASMILGAIDKVFLGNRLGLGEKFDEGFNKMGGLAAAMIGMISLAPVLGNLLGPLISPLSRVLGTDPAIFAGMFLANDMGGYPLAMKLANTEIIGAFSGLIIGAMMGATIVFSIPVGLNMISKEDRRPFALGIMVGIIAIPFGSFAGGLFAGIPGIIVCKNLLPVMAIAVIISLGLWKMPKLTTRAFIVFSKLITAIAIFGAVAAGAEKITGFIVIYGMTPIEESFKIVGYITIMLLGAFPMMHLVSFILKKPLEAVGNMLKINSTAVAGIIAALANNVNTFSIFHKMDYRGKVVSAAFCVSGAFVFGDHLGFTAANDPMFITPVIAGKLIGGITGIFFALQLTKARPIS